MEYRDSSVNIGTRHRLDDRGSISDRDSDFSLLHHLYTGCGFHPAPYKMVLFPGIKRPGRETRHSPSFSAEIKNAWSFTSTLHTSTSSWRGA